MFRIFILGIGFHAAVVFGLGKNLSFKSVLGHCVPAPTAATNAYAKRKTGGKQRDAVLFLFNRIIHDGTFAAVYVVC